MCIRRRDLEATTSVILMWHPQLDMTQTCNWSYRAQLRLKRVPTLRPSEAEATLHNIPALKSGCTKTKTSTCSWHQYGADCNTGISYLHHREALVYPPLAYGLTCFHSAEAASRLYRVYECPTLGVWALSNMKTFFPLSL
jgi:hypothetical protein